MGLVIAYTGLAGHLTCIQGGWELDLAVGVIGGGGVSVVCLFMPPFFHYFYAHFLIFHFLGVFTCSCGEMSISSPYKE